MNIPDWVFIALAVAAIAIVIGFDQAERAARWRRDLDKPLSPRARRWAAEHQEPNEPNDERVDVRQEDWALPAGHPPTMLHTNGPRNQ